MRFAWQHDAHRRSDGAITVFDNFLPPARGASTPRAVALRVDEKAKTAAVISARLHPRGLLDSHRGQLSRNCPAAAPSSAGDRSATSPSTTVPAASCGTRALSLGFETYRAYRLPWVGLPNTRPQAIGARRGAGMDVFVSWNGATEVASWEISAGSSAAGLRPVASGPRTGFETKFTVPGVPRFVQSRARDAAGQVLSTSAPTRVR